MTDGCILIWFIPYGVPLKMENYNEVKASFSLLDPYELPLEHPLIEDIEYLTNCTCPRVFWPACGEDTETYFNACVLRCINITKMKRTGPCITYRRMNEFVLNFKIPTAWRNKDVEPFLVPSDKLEDVLVEFGHEIVKPEKINYKLDN
ncbi:hypothetical protein PYW08_010078 [Mythimna loreyi]|uniref:Uncharacterized protein n=1 Tax=Mythimna loreyi TaxID=667449 RepID=A0ACC2Q777_9NEOP|nr:hypothetical protein PYW08_010078 [Mythimna loreyi]